MILFKSTKLVLPRLSQVCLTTFPRECHSIFGIQKIMLQERPCYSVSRIPPEHFEMTVELIKRNFLTEHVLCQSRNIDLSDDRAVDEYLVGLLKQGNSLYAQAKDGAIAGVCVNYASGLVDPSILRQYAFYRQDPDTKDFFYFTAKLQETPNLWKLFDQPKIFEIRMLTVLPTYRRQGVAIKLVERSRELALDQNFKVTRFDCINEFDFKIAERCMMQCLVRMPLHLLRGINAPFIRKNSDHNRWIRVYVDAQLGPDLVEKISKIGTITPNSMGELEIENLFE